MTLIAGFVEWPAFLSFLLSNCFNWQGYFILTLYLSNKQETTADQKASKEILRSTFSIKFIRPLPNIHTERKI